MHRTALIVSSPAQMLMCWGWEVLLCIKGPTILFQRDQLIWGKGEKPFAFLLLPIRITVWKLLILWDWCYLSAQGKSVRLWVLENEWYEGTIITCQYFKSFSQDKKRWSVRKRSAKHVISKTAEHVNTPQKTEETYVLHQYFTIVTDRAALTTM